MFFFVSFVSFFVFLFLLFLIYINDLHLAIKFSDVHHFENDTNLNFNSSENSINKQVHHDLRKLANCLKTYKISLNVGKTELALFISPKKQLDN